MRKYHNAGPHGRENGYVRVARYHGKLEIGIVKPKDCVGSELGISLTAQQAYDLGVQLMHAFGEVAVETTQPMIEGSIL